MSSVEVLRSSIEALRANKFRAFLTALGLVIGNASVILVVTMLMGATWLAHSRRSARRQVSLAWSFPPRLIWLHGLAAVCSITLTVLTAVTASRA